MIYKLVIHGITLNNGLKLSASQSILFKTETDANLWFDHYMKMVDGMFQAKCERIELFTGNELIKTYKNEE